MEISHDMKRYILVAIAGIAIAAYVVPTSGWLDLNTAFAGGKPQHGGGDKNGGGDIECRGGDGGDGGDGGVAIATISQSVDQNSDRYGNTATLVNTGDAEADADGGDGGDGGDCSIGGSYGSGDVELVGGDGGKGGDGGVAIASISQSVSQSSGGGGGFPLVPLTPVDSALVDGTTGGGNNEATVVNTGDAEASAEGGDGGDGGDAEGGDYGSKGDSHDKDEGDVEAEGGDGGDGGDGGVAIASIDQDVEQDSDGGDNEATVVNTGDAEADADGGDGGDGGDAEVEED